MTAWRALSYLMGIVFDTCEGGDNAFYKKASPQYTEKLKLEFKQMVAIIPQKNQR
jgi:hypothetical protein